MLLHEYLIFSLINTQVELKIALTLRLIYARNSYPTLEREIQ